MKIWYNKLKLIFSEEDVEYYGGCPISPSKMCVYYTQDLKVDEKERVMACENCMYKGKYKHTCIKKIKDLKIPSNAVIKKIIRNANGDIEKIDFYIDDTDKVYELKPQNEMLIGNSILDLWWKYQPSVATFENIRNGCYVRINKDPNLQIKKYHTCYGKYSYDKYNFSYDSTGIKNYSNPEWILVWKK